MLLRSVQSSGLKGQDFRIELGPGTALVGANATGKTAIIEAIKFVCRGTFPEVKKGSWPMATVTGHFDNGKLVGRSINPKGTVKTDTAFSPEELAALDIPLLDPEHYFGLTDTQRTHYVFERVKLPDTLKPQSILSEIERISLGEEHTDLVEKAKGDLVLELRKIFDASGSIQEALAIAVEQCRTRFTYWNRRAKETQGAVTTLTELKLREKNVVAAPADLDRQIAAKRKTIEEVVSELGALRQKAQSAEMEIANRRSLEKMLNQDRVDYDTMLKRARERQQPLAHEFERLNTEVMAIDSEYLDRQLEMAAVEQRKTGEAAAVFDSVCLEITNAMEALEKQDHCPYCQAEAKGWKERARLALKKKLSKAESTYKAQLQNSQAAEAKVKDLRKKRGDFVEIKAAADAMKAKLKVIGDDIDRITGEKERDDKRRAEWKERLSKIQPVAAPGDFKAEIAALEQKLRDADKEIAQLDEERTAETRLQQDIVRAGEAAKEHATAAAQVAVTKKIGKLLDERRAAMVELAFGALLKTANQFATGILKSPLAMSEGVIGRWHGSTFIGHHWFSGTEKAVTYVAIAAALSSAAPFKLLILDEFGRLDQANQIKVQNRLIEFQKSGVIDQFVIAGTSIPTGADKNLKVIEVK